MTKKNKKPAIEPNDSYTISHCNFTGVEKGAVAELCQAACAIARAAEQNAKALESAARLVENVAAFKGVMVHVGPRMDSND